MALSDLRPEVIIIGAGLAGIRCAHTLAHQGRRLLLLERSSFLGGRAGAPHGRKLGVRLVLGCCTSYLQLLKDLGTHSEVQLQPNFRLTVATANRHGTLTTSRLPAPFHLLNSFLRFPFLTPGDKVAVMRGLIGIKLGDVGRPDETLSTWLDRHHQPASARSTFWELLSVPAVNTPPDLSSARLGLKVFHTALLGRHQRLALATVPHQPQKLLTPVISAVNESGGEVCTSSVVKRIGKDDFGWRVWLADGSSVTGKALVLALPPWQLGSILPSDLIGVSPFSNLAAFQPAGILDVSSTFASPVWSQSVTVIPGDPALWIFPKTLPDGCQRLDTSISCPGFLLQEPEALVERWVLKKLQSISSAAHVTRIVGSTCWRHQAATFLTTPAVQALRPPPITSVSGLFLAGDWTATNWPATMEGAVLSGEAAAIEVSGYLTSIE